ncbi:fatty-acyl-CoA synthase [Archangium gephyra]|uniref:Acetyl-coenzyme A synthetase n=1 Tax=Archangium gephyra TaxID=48 RepID=A0AAC8Q7I4_9BACT
MRHPQVVAQHWKLVERYRPTVVGGIPTSLVSLLEVPLCGEDIQSVEFCVTGGAPLPTAVAHDFERRFGLPVHEIYGMTECAGLISVAPRHLPPRYGASGYRVPGVEVEARRLLGDCTPGERLPDGETGVLVVRGPNVFPGYLNPKQNEAAFTADGWLNTGDLGSVAADGLVRVTGRAKDVIIRGGHNIDPAGIEEAANSHPAVAVSAAVGMPDAYAGEVPLLFVTLKQDSTVSLEDLRVHLRANVPEGPARPREVVILPEMPMTAVGKISKPVLRRDATRRAAAAAAAAVLEGTQVESHLEVEEKDDGRPLVRVRLLSCPEELRPALAVKLSDALSRFTFTHALGFA